MSWDVEGVSGDTSVSCPRLSFGGTVPSKKTPAHRVTGAAYSLRCRGSRRCRDAPVGAPPEGNAKEVTRRQTRHLRLDRLQHASTDCGPRRPRACRPPPPMAICTHLRRDMQLGFRNWASDADCDDGGPGYEFRPAPGPIVLLCVHDRFDKPVEN